MIETAFRCTDYITDELRAIRETQPTLLDQIAISAMNALLQNNQILYGIQEHHGEGVNADHIAQAAYIYAKAMMMEKEKQ